MINILIVDIAQYNTQCVAMWSRCIPIIVNGAVFERVVIWTRQERCLRKRSGCNTFEKYLIKF